MSLVSRSKNFIYFHFPKTGGTSFIDPLLISEAITKRDYEEFYLKADHEDAQFVKNNINEHFFYNAKKIATTRNPFAIIISEYFFKRNQPEGSGQQHIDLCRKLSIKDFIIKFCETDWNDDKHAGHFKIVRDGQFKFHSINTQCVLDDYLKLEEISQEKINNLFGFDMPLVEKKNTFGDVKKYRQFYDKETQKLVEELFEKDLNYFNYEF